MRFMHFVRPLARLFRAAPPIRPAPVDRVAALDTGSPELIIATALGDGAETLRAAAVRKLPDGDVLRMLAGFGDGVSPPASSSLERVARERMAQLIDAGALDFAELCSSTENLAAVLAVAGFCGNPAHLPQALALIDDPHRVAALVTEGSSSRVRQLAAESIQDPAQLKQLLKQVRGKDKSVYKIIKQKCDVLRAEEQRIAQIDSDSQALCAALERHSRRDFDTLYTPSFEQLDARWRTLEAQAAPALRERADQAIGRCREVIAGQLRQLADRAAEASHQAAHQAEQRAARDEASARASAEAQLRNEATALAVAEAAKLREAEERARAERHAAEALVLRQIGGLMAKANSALRDGNTGRAAGLRRAIEEKLPTVPMVPAYLAGQVQRGAQARRVDRGYGSAHRLVRGS